MLTVIDFLAENGQWPIFMLNSGNFLRWGLNSYIVDLSEAGGLGYCGLPEAMGYFIFIIPTS